MISTQLLHVLDVGLDYFLPLTINLLPNISILLLYHLLLRDVSRLVLDAEDGRLGRPVFSFLLGLTLSFLRV